MLKSDQHVTLKPVVLVEDSSWTCASTTDNKTFSIMVLKESALSLEVLKASPELPLHSELCLVLQSVSAGSP